MRTHFITREMTYLVCSENVTVKILLNLKKIGHITSGNTFAMCPSFLFGLTRRGELRSPAGGNVLVEETLKELEALHSEK